MTTLKCVCSKPVSKGYCMQQANQLLNEAFPETIKPLSELMMLLMPDLSP